MELEISPYHAKWHKSEFDCTNEALNDYLKKQVSQDIRKKLTACFVLNDSSNNIFGYYTLSNSGIPQKNIPEIYAKKYPSSYQSIPVTLLGRLAIDKTLFKKGYGEMLLVDALKRSYEVSSVLGSVAVIVDPIDEAAEQFYLKYGFIPLIDSKRMFIPMHGLVDLFRHP